MAEALIYRGSGNFDSTLAIYDRLLASYYPPFDSLNRVNIDLTAIPIDKIKILQTFPDKARLDAATRDAIAYYGRLKREYPDHALLLRAARTNCGRIYAMTAQWDKAIDELGQVNDSTGQVDVNAQVIIANIYEGPKNDPDRALQTFQKILDRKPDSGVLGNSMLHMGAVLCMQKKFVDGRKALADVTDPASGAVLAKAGEQLAGFAQLRADGSTASGCWIFSGAWTQAGNQMARRDNADPYGMGQTLGWAWAWPANRRILYNRASADPAGQPWDAEKKRLVWWNGKSWGGTDVPDFKADSPPEAGMNPFIMNPEGVARFFAVDKMAEGPFPEHYEPFETPIGRNPLHGNGHAISNPAARVFKNDMELFGTAAEFPYAATTYRLTEHFHYWTKHCRLNAIVQPEQFVEIGEALARELGIKAGDRVKVSSNRGYIKAVAVVTKRLRPLTADGRTVHHIGIPIHWGFSGVAKNGFLTNTLTPFVGDANTQTPEFKSFLVNVEKV